MTAVTYVGADAGVSGDNASLQPTIHASAAAGDLMLLFASIRNSGAAAVKPAGWEVLIAGSGALFWRVHSGSESAPTVTFSGGSAGDDTLAQVGVFRTAAPVITGVNSSRTNVSAQDVLLPGAQTPDRDNSLVLVLAQKHDDWTSVATLAGMTEVGETTSVAGNDAGQVWDYRIDTTAAATPAGPLVVTGGAGAVSRSFLISLAQQAFVTVAEQDAWPPRVLVSVTNLVVGDSVEVYRVVGGARTLVRAGADDSVADVSFLRVDAELPFGVPVSYVAVVSGAEYATSPVTYTLPGGKVALSDAVGGLSAEVVVRAWPERAYDRQSSTFRTGGRNVVVAGDLAGYTAAVELYLEATSTRDTLFTLLDNATEGIIQIRQPGGYDGVDSYVAVLSAAERRFSQDGTDDRRIVALDVVEVESWAPSLEARGFTLQDLADLYTGLTLADLAGDYSTLLVLAQADLSA
jgi:hypothetical protein